MLGILSTVVIACAGFSIVILHKRDSESMEIGIAGMALAYSINIVVNLRFAAQNYAMIEAFMNSVERVFEYTQIDCEEQHPKFRPFTFSKASIRPKIYTKEVRALTKGWGGASKAGAPNLVGAKKTTFPFADNSIEFCGCELKYRPDLPPAVVDLNVRIEPGCCLGICGRTGSGKSSLFVILLRLTELTSGHVVVGNVRVTDTSLENLRRFITIIPQDPVLFSGSIRKNIDVFSNYSDKEIWDVLEMAQLATTIKALPAQLEDEVSAIRSKRRVL